MDVNGNVKSSFFPVAKPNRSNLEIEDNNRSLFWYNKMTGKIPSANKINYTKEGTEDDIVVCDVSSYTDGLPNSSTGSVTEPVISKRYKFIIKNASEIRTKLNAITGEAALETILITVPKGATGVNLQMEMTPENYYWGTNYQGSTFTATATDKDGNTIRGSFENSYKMFHFTNAINTETTVKIYARTNNNNNTSPCIALFKITPQEGWELSTETGIEGNIQRNPRLYPKRYEEIASYDFDLNKATTTLSVENNISTDPLPAEYTSYGFTNPTMNSLNEFFTPKRNNYGLYRSANNPNYSANNPTTYTIGTQTRKYDWYFARTVPNTVYDRTYERTKDTGTPSYGYFYYIDASEEAGRIVNVPIGETLCPSTELTVTAWVANMTDGNNTKPNLCFILRGVLDSGTEEEIHRFSTGELADPHHGEWLQIFSTFTLQSEQASRYSSYKVEIQNNALNSEGADYAIDDIRVYKSLPNISVQRNDACDASTFYVSSDYENILRNMGWSNDPNVVEGITGIDNGLTAENKHKWKYRYGLLGEDATNPQHYPYVGNMYLAFAKDMTKESKDLDAWVTMNTDLLEYDNVNYNKRSKFFRITIPTTYTGEDNALQNRFNNITTQEEARKLQILWNLRMVNDFLYDARKSDNIWDKVIQEYAIDPETSQTIEKEAYLGILEEGLKTLCGKTTWDYKIGEDEMQTHLQAIMANTDGKGDRYERLLRSVCSVLGISRLRVPWWTFDKDGNPLDIHLSAIDVQKTDLQYKGQQITGDDGTITTATGEYTVIIFSVRSTTEEPGMVEIPNETVNFKDPCLLSSPFTVQPSVTITIETKGEATSLPVCQSQITEVQEVTVWVQRKEVAGDEEEYTKYDTAFPNGRYTYDWFLGSLEEYNKLFTSNVTLQGILKAYREDQNKTVVSFSENDLLTFCEKQNYDVDVVSTLRVLLKGDTEQPKRLVIGDTRGKTNFPWAEHVVAIPYFPDYETESVSYIFCVDPQEQTFQTKDSPTMSIRFPNITSYPTDMAYVPLRIGLPNIHEGEITDAPIGKEITFGMDESSALGLPKNNDARTVFLLKGSESVAVGTVTALQATKENGGTFTLKFDTDTESNFHEGEEYRLYVPFQEYNNEEVVEGSCVGYADLLIRIVPEYLTWKGKVNNAWYNDGNWNQSTKGELYFDNGTGTSTEDANGTDNIQNAFAPLYFTKITLPENSTLPLENITKDEITHILSLTDKATENIQYNMTVNKEANGTVTVKPYYINRVSEIYFKPQATLMNQHFLTYDTARVEFDMQKGTSYWMSSPLHSVYAGDMYAPKNDGKQNTPAFDYISYSTDRNSRWNPAFYQKAWDKAIAYSTDETGSADKVVDVEAVKSNWSIEYNDVWVRYSIGKGFYARVEEQDVTVRLPKADTNYGYESKTATRALSAKGNRENSGKMANGKDITITLTDENIDGDGDHFLVGNPYMTYLNMAQFFETNHSLNKKYWTIENGTSKAVVGTPDISWTGNETENEETITGLIPPMTAFFVERADEQTEQPLTITFTTAMMANKAEATKGETPSTRSYSATNPVLTLTAERNGKKSNSIIALRDNADNTYQPQEDAIVLLDSELDAPVAYSVAGNRAAQVNAVKSICNIPVGIYNNRKEDVSLTIEGISLLAEPLYLYDSSTRSSTLLEGDSYTLSLSGESHGRYYLRSSAAGSINTNAITIYSVKNGKVIVSSTEEVRNIKVYALNGRLVKEMKVNTTQHTFNLPTGIYIVRAEGKADAVKTEKVIVR